MTLVVQKYGGTSVGDVERIQGVAERIAGYRARGVDVVVVVSAMSGETNRLDALGREMSAQPSPEYMDVLLSSGEQVSIALLSMALSSLGWQAEPLLGHQVAIQTDGRHGTSAN